MSDIEGWFKSLPVITKYYLCSALSLTVLTSLEVVNPYYLIFSWELVLKKLEIWRVVTSFCYFGNFGLPFLFSMMVLVRFTRALETHPRFAEDFASFVWCLIFLIFSILVFSSFASLLLLGHSLLFGMIYIWSKFDPQVMMPFWGGFMVKGYQIPFVLMGLRVLMGGSIIDDLIGLLAGQLYYMLIDTIPQEYGWNLLKTPGFIRRFTDQPPAGQRRGFQAYQGRGQPVGR